MSETQTRGRGRTENATLGAAAFESSGDALLDLFFSGMVRDADQAKLDRMFAAAWAKDTKKALQVIMHARDCRAGKGEKEVVLKCLTWLRANKPQTYCANLRTFVDLGYHRDLLQLAQRHKDLEGDKRLGAKGELIELELFAELLQADWAALQKSSAADDGEADKLSISLAGKWAPSDNKRDAWNKPANGGLGRRMRNLVFPDSCVASRDYRKMLSALRAHLNVVEAAMSAQQWDKIKFESVPSRAHKNYRAAFKKHEPARYEEFIGDVKSGKKTIKTAGLQLHDCVAPYIRWQDQLEGRRAKAGGKSGELTITLVWNDPTDLDLHCIVPGGAEISYSQRTQAGGTLDIDMNAGGDHSLEAVENIVWPENAPQGRFRVFVHNYGTRSSAEQGGRFKDQSRAVPFQVFMKCGGEIQTFESAAVSRANVDCFVFDYAGPAQPATYHEVNNSADKTGLTDGDDEMDEEPQDDATLEVQWQAMTGALLEDAKQDVSRALAMVDVSGSMTGTPMAAAIALGIVTAERAQGPFRNRILTFDSEPSWCQLPESKEASLRQKVETIVKMPWGESTDLTKACRQILQLAVAHRVPESSMPERLFVFSDMQFDLATKLATDEQQATALDAITQEFRAANYAMPQIVFWNLTGRTAGLPATADDATVALVSGYSAAMLRVLSDGFPTSLELLDKAIAKYAERVVVIAEEANSSDSMSG